MGTLSDPLRAAQALRVTIRATRQETEEARCLAPQVVEGLIDAGLCRLAVPASLGGHEAEPVLALQVYEELAWADASVAWIAWNNQLVCLASRYASDGGPAAHIETDFKRIPLGTPLKRHTRTEFVDFLAHVMTSQSLGREIHIIADNLSARKTRGPLCGQSPSGPHSFSSEIVDGGKNASSDDLSKILRYIRHYNKTATPVKRKPLIIRSHKKL